MIDKNYFWLVVFGLAAGTLSIRGSIIMLSSCVIIPNRLKELFSFIPAAVLPALIAPMVFFHQGHVNWLLGKERFFVLILATLVCLWSRSMLLTIGFGLTLLFTLTHY